MTKGISASQAGVDISQALDSQKVLDSRWRYFEILAEYRLTLPTIPFTVGTDVVYHKAGFLPAFDIYDITRGEFIGSDLTGGPRSNTDKIYFQGLDAGGVSRSNHEALIRVYNVPITEEYTAEIDKTFPAKTKTVSKTGIKVTSKSGVMGHNELSEFNLNTQSKALSIQKTGVVTTNSGTNFLAVIRHDIGNPPTFLATRVDPTLQWVAALDPSNIPAVISANSETVTLRGGQAALIGSFAYIIFKELADFSL